MIDILNNKILFNYNLGPKTWFGTGGRCFCFFEVNSVKHLQFIVKYLPSSVPLFVIGAGSNIIIRDGGINGIVIKLGKSFSSIELQDENRAIKIGAAAKDLQISKFCLDKKITGFEFLSGIPGTLGGNLKMNAGCYGQEISSNLVECTIISSNGKMLTRKKKEISFGYRTSTFHDDIIIDATFTFKYDHKNKIMKKIKRITADRKKNQPIGVRTGGSTFSNPKNNFAWKLIDAINYRGKINGGAQVSNCHSNFFINKRSATSLDLELLGEDIRNKVWKKFKIKLEWEILRIGEFKKI